MKKNKLKNYLKLGILLFGVSISLVNCVKDDDFKQTTKQEQLFKNNIPFEFKKKSYAQLNNEVKFVSAINNVFNKGKTKSRVNAKTVMEDQYGFTIDSTLIKEISSDDFTSYTFLIHREVVNESVFENLVVTINNDSVPKAYIIKYHLNSDPIYISEDNAYAIDSHTELTEIDYNNSQLKVSYTDSDGCTIVTIMCPYGGSSHAAGQACFDADRGDLYFGYDSSNCGDSSGGGGGGGGSGGTSGGSGDNGGLNTSCRGCGDTGGPILTDPIWIEEIEDNDCLYDFICRSGEILDEDCECQINLLDPCANKDLINYEVSQEVITTLESRQQPNSMVQSSAMVDSFILETIDDGWGDVNQDRFSIKIDQLPNGYTPFQLFNDIRMNFTNLVVGGDIPYITDVNLEPYSSEDEVVWNSNNPLGAAMDFNTMIDTSTVYCVEYNEDEMYWVFATVTSYDHQGHFVAGIRQFGLEPNGSGGYSFYVRAADRLGGALDYIANGLSGNEEALFTQAADPTWKNLMSNTQSFIENNGGAVQEFDENKTYGTRHPYDEDNCL